jgi:alanyl-tRNA synthetase
MSTERKDLSSSQIRSMFLQYFQERGHMVEPSASLIPHDDPTLLWINAGVAALKKYFDGSEKPKCRRITNAQKSIRTNDIENVGRTSRHHTFFEMLGNFSIGDYFKKEAIPFAWHFLTDPEWMGFDKDRWYITVYTDDQEAYDIWTRVCGVDPSHILRSPNNFWEIGNGPCGPDTEMYYDRGEAFDPRHLGEKLFFEELENDRYIEIWNIVFSQFNSEEGVDRKDYKELPQKNIDTGMGLERLVCIAQGGETNFDTDLFLPIIHAAEQLSGKSYDDPAHKMAFRAIADHIRTVTFALADGANFSNEGRGYILRRVLRRAVRFGRSLQIRGPYLYRLVPVVADNMKDYYPYLQDKVDYIAKLVKGEEEKFEATLNDGEKILNEVMAGSQDRQLSGAVVFKLYDTYGFPLELTKEIAGDAGFTVDQAGFDALMEQQRARARAARGDEQSMSSQHEDLMAFTTPSEFVGYDRWENDGTVTGLFVNGEQVGEVATEGDVALDQTCFYAESGGQLYDTGTMVNDTTRLKVVKVEKAPQKQPLHHVIVEQGCVKVGDRFHLAINGADRKKMMANHSSLHLLQAALRKVLGDHVHQAGSFVCADYGRFDFTHYEKPSDEQLREVEQLVNQWIAEGLPVTTRVMGLEEAKKTGAMALFDEKYGDRVRVVAMGDVSQELCGGTHVDNTSRIGLFKILSEESIGSGIRRITSCTSYAAYQAFVGEQDDLRRIAGMLKLTSYSGDVAKVEQLLAEKSAMAGEISQLKGQLSAIRGKALAQQAIPHDGLSVLVAPVEAESGELKDLALGLLQQLENGVVLLAAVHDGKATFTAAVAPAAVQRGIKASDLVRQAAQICGGNGGGRPELASAGGRDGEKVPQALAAVRQTLGL